MLYTINGKNISKKTTPEQLISEAERLCSKSSNMIVVNDSNRMETEIIIYNKDCTVIEHKIQFKNPYLEADKKEDEILKAELIK